MKINLNSVGFSKKQNKSSNNQSLPLTKSMDNDSFTLSNKKQVVFKGGVLTAFVDWTNALHEKYDADPALKDLINLVEKAQYNDWPIEKTLQRGDFKGFIPKETIVKVLESGKNQAEMNGTKKMFQRCIDHVQSQYS